MPDIFTRNLQDLCAREIAGHLSIYLGQRADLNDRYGFRVLSLRLRSVADDLMRIALGEDA